MRNTGKHQHLSLRNESWSQPWKMACFVLRRQHLHDLWLMLSCHVCFHLVKLCSHKCWLIFCSFQSGQLFLAVRLYLPEVWDIHLWDWSALQISPVLQTLKAVAPVCRPPPANKIFVGGIKNVHTISLCQWQENCDRKITSKLKKQSSEIITLHLAYFSTFKNGHIRRQCKQVSVTHIYY